MKLIKKRNTDARAYNLPTADEIAALIIGDFDPENVKRDIIVEKRSGTLQQHKLTNEALIDLVICAEILDSISNPKLYISPCEAIWRIFGFDINFREPSVECLPFHLPDEQGVVFPNNVSIDAAIVNATVKQTKFLAWFEANKKYPKAKSLTYAQFPTQFVYKDDCRQLFKRKAGPTSFEDIRTINGVVYPTFKDASYVKGVLEDDKEYIEDIKEGSKWSTGLYLRKLFATLLIHNTISRPVYVWENTWMYLSDDILLKERHHTDNPNLHLDDECIKDIALLEIENLLKINVGAFQTIRRCQCLA
ncbi:uncharacterized protein G2W53_037417 [Senna tora]|uniref:Uncharacterized protein n=1 Tax=Senna tora TaxID=362788 RepID=A0A834T6D7_9FABA|nr:uncharacterized protein G2W53_037417 [Senna tora]